MAHIVGHIDLSDKRAARLGFSSGEAMRIELSLIMGRDIKYDVKGASSASAVPRT